jgi:phospholipase C
MTALNRRRFLQIAGGSAALPTLSALTPSIARAAAIAPNVQTGTLQDVEHIVVLMQENRSFDHYFGSLRGVRGFGDPRPVTLPSGKPVWYQSDGARDVLPFRPDVDDLGLAFLEDLPHGWNDGHSAFNGGKYDKWVPAKSATTMAYLERQDVPFHYALADAFTICDAYHCAFIGSTDPNRYYMWTGYTGNDGVGGGPVLNNAEAGYDWTTYPERLQAAGVSWKIYQDVGDGLDAAGSWGWINDAYRGNYGDNSLLYFHQYQNAVPGSPLYDRARTGTDARKGEGFFDQLRADVLGGNLPQVSWVVAPEAFTEHPNWPANYGAWYIAQMLDALTADPDVWSKTALFITYDENDGFFDHLVPPYPPLSASGGASTVDTAGELFPGGQGFVPGQYGLGQRVPMLVVSPWSKGGWVCSQTFDHTSIVRFIEQRFGVAEPNISPWRRSVCGDLTAAFDFARTDVTVPALPDTSAYQPPDNVRHPDYHPVPPTSSTLPSQEPGVRPARALPYDLAIDGHVDTRLRLELTNLGSAGAAFLVTSTTDQHGPWTYTVAPGGSLSGKWSVGSGYDFAVHGPNGFFRRFAGGSRKAGVEAVARHDAATGAVRLVVDNHGKIAAEVTVRDAYGNQQTTLVVRAGARTTYVAQPASGANNWYDLSVTVTGDAAFVRQFAGHVETGRPSTSDPAIAAG